jgi:hypothetical protein
MEATVLSSPGCDAVFRDDSESWSVTMFLDALSCFRSGLPLHVGSELAAFLAAATIDSGPDSSAEARSGEGFSVVSVEADPR